jgi:HYDIN/CFA65/VesB-like, Ig-like domain
VTLNGGQSATFTVKFAPTAPGAVSGNLTVTSTATNPTLTIPVSGTGVSTAVAQLSVSPSTLALGSVMVGSSGTGTGTVTASGASVTVSAASANNSVFTIGGFSLPHTIAAGQSANFTITFSPSTSGAASATLTFTSNAQPSTTTETLTGTGTPAPTHSVALSWNASTSQDITGYNIYRAGYTTSCGSFSKINSVLNTGTLYTDSSVKNGSAYCFATTAVDTSNAESAYSNVVSNVKIPAQ